MIVVVAVVVKDLKCLPGAGLAVLGKGDGHILLAYF